MKRLPSTLAASAWLGFAGGFCLVQLLQVTGLAGLLPFSPSPAFTAMLATTDGAAPIHRLISLALSLGLCASLVSGLVLLHGKRRGAEAGGETAVALAFAALSAMALATAVTGLPIGPFQHAGSSLITAFVVSFAALGFDHLVSEPDGEEDSEAFLEAISTIAAGMARQTRLYTQPRHD
ncbi:hypothetical protein [Consotaella aegiceratis]|uniref:hypothetical protein n=1 Tax=Consotaella aegiceratis TaxID=3097961 RepID=UPI002F3E32B7